MQQIIIGKNSHKKITCILQDIKSKKFLLVRDSAFKFLDLKEYFNKLAFPYAVFEDFTPNPLYEDVCRGIDTFKKERCDSIIAIGGGSAIDVAKCIKLFSQMDDKQNYLEQVYLPNEIPLIALPTTAGTGSESTKYSVIYYKGEKQSVTHESLIPSYAILDYEVLKTLPLYQKKCTMLDALCQGIESYWSVNSNAESKAYSSQAIQLIMDFKDDYLKYNNEKGNEKIMLASNLAGRAINISQTTAAHAMSYKITSMYGLPHGHAVAICLPKIWRFMIDNSKNNIDSRGKEYVIKVFKELAILMGKENANDAVILLEKLINDLEIYPPLINNKKEIEILSEAVNVTRLKNNPIQLSKNDLYSLYKDILLKDK